MGVHRSHLTVDCFGSWPVSEKFVKWTNFNRFLTYCNENFYAWIRVHFLLNITCRWFRDNFSYFVQVISKSVELQGYLIAFIDRSSCCSYHCNFCRMDSSVYNSLSNQWLLGANFRTGYCLKLWNIFSLVPEFKYFKIGS